MNYVEIRKKIRSEHRADRRRRVCMLFIRCKGTIGERYLQVVEAMRKYGESLGVEVIRKIIRGTR